MSFQPTPESIPPPAVGYRLHVTRETLSRVNFTPLNPLGFLLRAALIYPDHIAIVHQDVQHPVSYTYAVWYGLRFWSSRHLPDYGPLTNRAQRIQNLAYALIGAGIQPGDRVAVLAPNW
jgi:hypothetical protein